MAYVYRHIRLDKNQPFYIGVGLSDNHRRAYEKRHRNVYWNNIISKTAYEVEILIDNLTEEEAFNKEVEFISLYGKSLNGGLLCNISDGGGGGYLGDEVNEKRRKSLLGKKLSSAVKDKIRQKAIGRFISEETRQKMSLTHKERGTGNWLKSKGHYNGRAKKVAQYSIDGELIKIWDCGVYACNELSINKACLFAALNENQKTAGGFIWKLASN